LKDEELKAEEEKEERKEEEKSENSPKQDDMEVEKQIFSINQDKLEEIGNKIKEQLANASELEFAHIPMAKSFKS